MQNPVRLALVLVVAFPLIVSCAALHPGAMVKAAFNTEGKEPPEAVAHEPEREGWAARNVPGWKAASGLFPPPTEARKKWDRKLKRGNDVSDYWD